MLSCERMRPDELAEAPTTEVRVYRFGHFIHSVLCTSDDEVAEAVRGWEDIDGVVCEVDDVTNQLRREHAIEPEEWYEEHPITSPG
jgi:hypothetical protein